MHSNMSTQWLPQCRFYFRRLLQTQPLAFAALLATCALCIGTLALYAQQSHSADTAQTEWRTLNQHAKDPGRTGAQTGNAKPDLPAFNNTALVEALNGAAEETKLTLDEISFLLDDNASQPYLRYRATLTVSSGYPIIRRFLDSVRVKQPEVSLDAITCTRDDIATVELTCDLALSAFYRKEAHG